jgi:hypothetical protein
LKSFGLKTSLIIFTKCHKHSNVVFFPILQYSSQLSTTWPYASMGIFGWSSIWQYHMCIYFVQNKCRVYKCYPWCRGIMCDAFAMDNKKINRCRLHVLQNNLAQFDCGWFLTFELHLGYDLGGILHVAFLHVGANLVLATSKHQTED